MSNIHAGWNGGISKVLTRGCKIPNLHPRVQMVYSRTNFNPRGHWILDIDYWTLKKTTVE